MRVRDYGGRAARQHEFSETGRTEHGRLDMHMPVNKAGQQICSPGIRHLPRGHAGKSENTSLPDTDGRREKLPAEHIRHHCVVDAQIGFRPSRRLFDKHVLVHAALLAAMFPFPSEYPRRSKGANDAKPGTASGLRGSPPIRGGGGAVPMPGKELCPGHFQ